MCFQNDAVICVGSLKFWNSEEQGRDNCSVSAFCGADFSQPQQHHLIALNSIGEAGVQ